MQSIGKILPIEGYRVHINQTPPVDYMKSLTHFYQPLIGMEAIILYITLLNEIDLQQESTPQTHHILMNYLNVPLDLIYEARLKLEGIGLLKTYEHEIQTTTFYTYQLQCPFSPTEFLQDAMLSELLYHHLGHDRYESLKTSYNEKTSDIQGEDITASFSDVFQTVIPKIETEGKYVQQETDKKTPNIDFTWMEMMLKQRMIPVQRVLTPSHKKLISEMRFLYGLASHEVEKAVLWALTDTNDLDTKEFKEACHDIFKTNYKDSPIQLNLKQNQQLNQETQQKQTADAKVPQTKDEKLIDFLENISPKELLEQLSAGNQASEQDMEIIREVMVSQGLPAPVMNVLIHYVLLQSDMKLSKRYMEKIASHWSRVQLKTAKEAMVFARKELEKFQQARQKKGRQPNHKRTEVIPEWFKERNQKKQVPAQKVKDGQSTEEERQSLAALIQQFSND